MKIVSSKAIPDDEIVMVTGFEGNGPIQINGQDVPDSVLEAFRTPPNQSLEILRGRLDEVADTYHKNTMEDMMKGFRMDTSEMEKKALQQISENVISKLSTRISDIVRNSIEVEMSLWKYVPECLVSILEGAVPGTIVLVVMADGRKLIGEFSEVNGRNLVIAIGALGDKKIDLNMDYIQQIKMLEEDEFTDRNGAYYLTELGELSVDAKVVKSPVKETLDLGE